MKNGPTKFRAGSRELNDVADPITPALLRRWPLPEGDKLAGKEGRGCVLVIGGSQQVPGAVILAATAALRAGAGKLQVATHRDMAALVAVALPEARVAGLRATRTGELDARSCRVIRAEIASSDCILIGPGMTSPGPTIDLLRALESDVERGKEGKTRPTLVVDAGALDAFRGRLSLARTYPGGVIVTPHAGEMANLWGVSKDEVLADPLTIARRAARELGVVAVLKGACTYVGTPEGKVLRNTTGNRGLGTSGSGDALAGIIAGLCARGASPVQAAMWGIFLHGKAGDVLARRVGSLGFLARELSAELPRLLDDLGDGRGPPSVKRRPARASKASAISPRHR